jgi:hypothetical protein
MKTERWIFALSFVLAAAGFLLPFWPLELAGVLLAALSGHWIFAVGLGLLLDLAYGAPVGRFEFLYLPFTLAALLGALVYRVGLRYLFDATRHDTL